MHISIYIYVYIYIYIRIMHIYVYTCLTAAANVPIEIFLRLGTSVQSPGNLPTNYHHSYMLYNQQIVIIMMII